MSKYKWYRKLRGGYWIKMYTDDTRTKSVWLKISKANYYGIYLDMATPFTRDRFQETEKHWTLFI